MLQQISTIAQDFADRVFSPQEQQRTSDELDDIVYFSMHEIYTKYVDADRAAMEVNISSRKRRSLVNIFSKSAHAIDAITVITAMENAVVEISLLLNDSRAHFGEQFVFTELAIEITRKRALSDSNDSLSSAS